MTKIRHTKDRESHYRMANVEFPAGTREIEVKDEVAEEAIEHKYVELAEEPEEPEEEEYSINDSPITDGYDLSEE